MSEVYRNTANKTSFIRICINKDTSSRFKMIRKQLHSLPLLLFSSSRALLSSSSSVDLPTSSGVAAAYEEFVAS
eukprot:scaffold2325_cov126-Cylindrotheca_fusiformis.AAC.5